MTGNKVDQRRYLGLWSNNPRTTRATFVWRNRRGCWCYVRGVIWKRRQQFALMRPHHGKQRIRYSGFWFGQEVIAAPDYS